MLFDLHNDLLTAELTTDETDGYICKSKDTSIMLAVWTTRLKEPLKVLENRKNIADKYENCHFAVEDLFFLNDDNLADLTALKPSYCTLTWSGENCLGGAHDTNSGLTKFGRSVICELDKCGIATDVAHLGRAGFWQVIESKVRVLNTHCCMDSIHSHSRNMSDEMICALIKNGGITGITAVSAFMGQGNATRKDFLNQLVTYAGKFGIDTLAVGTDFNGTDPIEGLKTYDDFDILKNELKKEGFSDQSIHKIFYQNAYDFFIKK